MQQEDGYYDVINLTRRQSFNGAKDPSRNLCCYKVALGISLAGIVALVGVVIFLTLQVRWGTSKGPHPGDASEILGPRDLFRISDNSTLDFEDLLKFYPCLSNSSDASHNLCVATPKDTIRVVDNHTATMPFYLRLRSPKWDFVDIKWHFKGGQVQMLHYEVRNCIKTGLRWWECSCLGRLEVLRDYQQRVAFQTNAWLVIRNVQNKDAGRYCVTAWSTEGQPTEACVNLAVIPGYLGKPQLMEELSNTSNQAYHFPDDMADVGESASALDSTTHDMEMADRAFTPAGMSSHPGSLVLGYTLDVSGPLLWKPILGFRLAV